MNRAQVTFLAALGLATACSNVGPTETIVNDSGLTVEEVSVRYRGEEGSEFSSEGGEMTFGEASGDYENLIGSSLAPEAEAAISLDCGIYDLRVVASSTTGADACEFAADADNPQGSVYLCFVDGIWNISGHLNSGNCPQYIFPE